MKQLSKGLCNDSAMIEKIVNKQMDAESLDIFGLHHPDTVIFRTQL